jgi:hypothetical protein
MKHYFKDESYQGDKKGNDKIAVPMCVNMDGSEKMP